MSIFKTNKTGFASMVLALCLFLTVSAADALNIKSEANSNLTAAQISTIERSKQTTTSNKMSNFVRSDDEHRGALTFAVDIDQDLFIVNSGDVFSIRIWKPGLESSEYPAAVINGKIFLEMIGEIVIAGLSLRQATENISKIYAEKFPQFKVYVTLSSMRMFNVLVAGQVTAPGFYTATPMTRLSDMVEMAGGFLPNGSARSVKVSSGDGKSNAFDLFKFGDAGDAPQNPMLKEKDSVFVPVRYGVATITGDALKPGDCEILEGDTLYSLKQCFKGIAPQGHRGRLVLKRPTASAVSGEGRYTITALTWEDFNGEAGRNILLTDGDTLEIGGPAESEFVIINGQVRLPGQYLYMKGMRVSDILNSAGGLKIVSDTKEVPSDARLSERQAYAASVSGVYKLLINRVNRQSGNIDTILINLTSLLVLDDEEQDIALMPGDVLSVTVNLDVVYVHGMVARPGFFPYDPSYTVRDFIFSAGGPAREGDIGRAKLTRDGKTRPADLNEKLISGDSIYVSTDVKSSTRNNISFISNLITFYLMLDRVWD